MNIDTDQAVHEVTVLHGCEVKEFTMPKVSRRCDRAATLYSSDTGKTYWLCPHHFDIFAKGSDLRASDEAPRAFGSEP